MQFLKGSRRYSTEFFLIFIFQKCAYGAVHNRDESSPPPLLIAINSVMGLASLFRQLNLCIVARGHSAEYGVAVKTTDDNSND